MITDTLHRNDFQFDIEAQPAHEPAREFTLHLIGH